MWNFLSGMFVSPWFAVAGAALATIPVIIHILNRRRFKTVRWAAMEYLLQAMRKNRRRLKFEQLLLLAIRCALLLLMGIALARPLACDGTSMAAMGGKRTALHVFVIDNSYSMAYEPGGRGEAKTHLDQAKLMAKGLIDRLSAGNEQVMIITASSPIDRGRSADPRAVTPKPTYDLQGARQAIDRIEQTWAGTDLDGALQLAIRTAQEEIKVPTKRIYIFSDATKSSFEGPDGQAVDALKQTGPQLAKLFGQPRFFALGKVGQWNQAVLDVAAKGLVTTKAAADLSARVRGFGAGPDATLQWKLNEVPVGNMRTVKMDLDTRPQTLNNQNIVEGGPHVFSLTLAGAGTDRLSADNTRWRVVDVAAEMPVLIVEGDRGPDATQDPTFFLKQALFPAKQAEADVRPSSSGGAKTDSYVAPTPSIGELELPNKILANYRAVFLVNVGEVSALQADQLKRFVEQGGALIIFAGPAVSAKNYNDTLTPRGLLPGRLVKAMPVLAKGYHFDFNPEGNLHPFLQEFKGVPNSGLNTAEILSYWQLELNSDKGQTASTTQPALPLANRVLDYQADEGKAKDPAITEHSLGKGRVVFCSTTANPEWNSLSPKPVYLALIHEMLAGSVGNADQWMNLTVGETLDVPLSVGLTAAPTLVDSAKNAVVMESATTEAGVTTYRSARPMTRPGIYQLGTGARTIPIAVNVPAAEADVRVVSADAVKKGLGDIALVMEDDSVGAGGMKVESGNDLSWAFMFLVLLLAGFECFCAMSFGHYKRGSRGTTVAAAAAPEPAAA